MSRYCVVYHGCSQQCKVIVLKNRAYAYYILSSVSASMHIHNAQIKGTQHKSMVKLVFEGDGYTSWSIHSIVNAIKETVS